MNTFQFANTDWIHAVWLVLGTGVLLIALELRGRHVLDLLVSRLLQTRLVYRPSLPRRVGAILLAVLAMLMLVLAMMRPQWGMTVQHIARVGSQVMVCLDVSKSMLAEDVAPNRLDRAKIELDSLLGLMDEGQQVGLLAFAGKATVLCPMTTDFGFLRLVLNETGPRSVGRGGTKIGDAIRKAVDGFRMAGDMNRIILLITDGEDHDSFPLEAAKQAKEKGIKIVCIGFGDEAGSKIEITDPETGIRSTVKDADGNDVVSHLDGDTLRAIALATDGVYIPAGTGALDLESIYRAHIATLLTGSMAKEQRVIHNEIYQWFVVAAICFLMMSLFTSTPLALRTRVMETVRHAPPSRAASLGAVLLVALGASAGVAAPAQDAGSSKQPAVGKPASSAGAPAPSSGRATSKMANGQPNAIDDTLPPRALYNQAITLLATDSDRAERYLTRARRDAGSDGELRFRALYNLGWVEVNRADALLKKEPKQALQHLQQAANRFRESARVRPDSVAARQNLELISRRILELTDALNKKDARDFAARLDELIQHVRQHQAELGQQIQHAAATQETADAETARRAYRRLAVTQRELIADMERFAESARETEDSLNKKPKDKQSAKDKLKAVQLANMLQFIDRSLQRMNMARGLTRRRQGDRAFRRWSTALEDTKRARDQLRNPVEVIGQILNDGARLATQTSQFAAGKSLTGSTPTSAGAPPAWLTREYLQDLQQSVTDRTSELEQLLQRIVAQQDAGPKQPNQSMPPSKTMPKDPRTQRLLDAIRAAVPLLHQAAEHFSKAADELKTNAPAEANVRQRESVRLLAEAWELFFDIRRLIEVVYQDEMLVKEAIQASAARPETAPQLRDVLTSTQRKNLARCARLDGMLQMELAKVQQPPKPTPSGNGPANGQPTQEQIQAQRERFQAARSLVAQIVKDIDQAVQWLEPTGESSPVADKTPPAQSTTAPGKPVSPDATASPSPKPDAPAKEAAANTGPARPTADADATPPAKSTTKTPAPTAQAKSGLYAKVLPPVDRALSNLEQLRRLFFTLVEHLRDTAQRQADLNDETAQLNPQPADKITPAKVGPLVGRQNVIRDVTHQIAEALKKQSAQASATAQSRPPNTRPPNTRPPNTLPPNTLPHSTPASGGDQAQKLGQAATLVAAAQQDMQTSATRLQAVPTTKQTSPPPLAGVQQSQADSLKKLLDALALLQPKQNQSNQQQQQQQNQKQQQQQKNQKQDQRQQQQNLSAKQLLQLIRDREAERRKDKKQNAAQGAAVGKDW